MGFRVNVDRLGNLSIDCDTVEDLREVIAMQGNNSGSKPRKRKTTKKRSETTLTVLQTHVWNYLCENDSEAGVPADEIGKHIAKQGYAESSSSPTLSWLVRNNFATKLDNGRFRAHTP